MAGRKPKPTMLKLIEGTARRDRMNDAEPQPELADAKCPAWVKGRARTFWRRHQPMLTAMRVLTTADVDAMASLCETEAEFWDAREDVHKRGIEIGHTRYTKDGHSYEEYEPNPSVKIASDAMKRMKAMMAEFGMTPSSRTRVKTAEKPKEADPLEELMKRRGG